MEKRIFESLLSDCIGRIGYICIVKWIVVMLVVWINLNLGKIIMCKRLLERFII